MSTRPLIGIAAVAAVLACQQPSRAEPDSAPPVSAADAAASKPTALSGFDIVATRPKPTSVSGVDVVVKRATKVSELEVTVPLCRQAKKTPEPADDGFKPGNSIVEGKGRFGDPPPPPKVVSTFPANGDVVRPGLLVVRVTFDRPMTCLGLLQNRVPFPDPCPPPLRAPMISRDKRTFLTVCTIEANRHYGLWLNNFASADGQTMPAREMVFDSSDHADITRVEEAMAQDKWLQKAVSSAR